MEGLAQKDGYYQRKFQKIKHRQGKHLISKHWLFWFSCEFPSSPLKLQAPTPFLSSVWHIILNHQLALESQIFGDPVHMKLNLFPTH